MHLRTASLGVAVLMSTLALAWAQGSERALTRQQADAFQQKVAQITAHPGSNGGTPRRTPVSESELNAWFVHRATPHIPKGIADPRINILGEGRVSGQAIVDLDVVSKRKASGGMLDPWSYVGGKVPVTVTGILHTQEGVGRFELQAAEVSGVPVPKVLLQELVTYYSRTPEHPTGISLDDPFALPSGIRRIEVGQAQAVVVQ